MLTPLTAISPIDGRYRNKTEKLADYFSEQRGRMVTAKAYRHLNLLLR